LVSLITPIILAEVSFELTDISPADFFGPSDVNLRLLESHFPKLKLHARGQFLKAAGDDQLLARFEGKFRQLLDFYHRYNRMQPADAEKILIENSNEVPENVLGQTELILFGTSGNAIRARTPNQLKLVKMVATHDMVFALGPAGTGKTYTAVALAVRALKNKEVKRIVLTRPAVEAGENLGFLPGDFKEKLDPYLQPLYDALRDMIPGEKLNSYLENGTIQIAPLAFMRGRTLDHAFVILDEAQNATRAQMKMFLTRMGNSARFVITGDITQIDLPHRQPSGLVDAKKLLWGIKGIGFVELDAADVVRHRLVREIILRYEAMQNSDKGSNTDSPANNSA
jgi:phosphate starvation-inducible PhoH-like protein